MANASPTTLLKALRKIVAMEIDNGFQDRAVQGGLDKFLATMRNDTVHPAIRALADRGMLDTQYAALDASLRARWTNEVGRLLSRFASTTGTAVSSRRVAPVASPVSPAKSVGLDDPAAALRAVTRAHTERLARLGVLTVRDLVFLFPNRHLDYSQRRTVAEVRPGHEQTIVVGLWNVRDLQLGRGGRLRATEAVVGDETGNLRVVWFGQPWLAASLRRSMERAEQAASGEVRLVLSGKATIFNGRQQMESPEWEVLEDPDTAESVHTGRLVPVYPSTERLPARTLRRMVREALDTVLGPHGERKAILVDPLPDALRERHSLQWLPDAVLQAHYPDSEQAKERARRRLAFDELLTLLLAVGKHRQANGRKVKAHQLNPDPAVVDAFAASLPFVLTAGQKLALAESRADIADGDRPMSRLLQGDVGSGKTVVALMLLLTAVTAGYQGAIMAPTEVLAEQHFLSIERMLEGLAPSNHGHDRFSIQLKGHSKPIDFGLITGSTKAKARRELEASAREGSLDILIGTHALIQDGVEVPRLGLAVVDEQHRFGVAQRAALRGKGGDGDTEPHLLVMSATPIPRTLQLTLFGDLDVSVIPELPTGRSSIQTRLVPPDRRGDAEQFLVSQAHEGRQSFVICPLIDESETVSARAATEEYERLRTGPLRDLRVGLLHGRMKVTAKREVMEGFRLHELDVLVATTVIEVGIDIPNATVMLVEGAERFGLAQLHQLRGRVGRGAHDSFCLLVPETLGDDARVRLEVLARTGDGFEIAEADLLQRGPGDFFGTRQSGLPTLRMARITDNELLAEAKEEAQELASTDPALTKHLLLAKMVERYTSRVVDEVG